jgi:UDP-N-acetylglucosamine 2-epimerase (non-hydrolysing)
MKLINVVGARPNLMKIAPIIEEMRRHAGIEQLLLHTGQHYDASLSQVFFDELGIPQPDIFLGVGSGSHAEQTARVMLGFEQVLLEHHPDGVVLVGDVNSTLACAITAAKLWIPVAHVEAGLRSFDRRMPEEINRIVTDALSDLLFTTSRDADANLAAEGIALQKVHFVGNVMIDTLRKQRPRAAQLETPTQFGLQPGGYALLTLHRPSNVDDPAVFDGIMQALSAIQREIPILFPVHPRTVRRLHDFGFADRLAAAPGLRLVEPQGYLAFLDLMTHARLVLTDSGGVQEETTILGVPCLTLRENTERPVTVSEGTNQLVGNNPEQIMAAARAVLSGHCKAGGIPEMWDGHAAQRIVVVMQEHWSTPRS